MEVTWIASWFKDKGATEEPEFVNPNTRLSRLHGFCSSKRNLIYCAFILRIVPVFERANVALQAEAPIITKIRAILLGLFRHILTRLVRPSVIRECENDILKIDYTLEKNQLLDKDLDLGSFANDLLKNLNSKSRAEIFSNARNFFMKALDYMKTSFPSNLTS